MKYLKKFKLFENQVLPEELIPLTVLKRSGLNSKKFYVELQKSIEGKSKEKAKEIAVKLLGKFNIDKITGVTGVKPEKRYHMSATEITGNEKDGKIKPTQIIVREQYNDWRKPMGLWYGFDESWIRHSLDEMTDSEFGFKKQKYHYEVYLKNGSNILKLITRKQVDEFIDEYKAEKVVHMSGEGIDWIRVAKDYQGIEFPNYTEIDMRQWHRRDMKYDWLYSVDVNSGCVCVGSNRYRLSCRC